MSKCPYSSTFSILHSKVCVFVDVIVAVAVTVVVVIIVVIVTVFFVSLFRLNQMYI